MDIKESKGVTAGKKKEYPPVAKKPFNPKRQFMAKEDAMKDNDRYKKANAAAEAARKAILDESAESEDQQPERESELTVAKRHLAEVVAKLEKKPTAALEKQKEKLENKIEELESKE